LVVEAAGEGYLPFNMSAGINEDVAKQRGYNLDIYLEPITPMRNTLAGREEKGLMKMVVDSDTQDVLGMHMVGPEAGEIIQGFATALKLGAKKQDVDATVGVHPSTAEEFCTMRKPSRHVPVTH
jgi:glutathione reductase (NADPH)